MIAARGCVVALPVDPEGFRVAGAVRALERGQGRRNPGPAPRSGGAAPPGHRAEAEVDRPRAARGTGPAAAAASARAPDRDPGHAAGVAPPPGRQALDPATAGGPTADPGCARRAHRAPREG